MRGSSSFFVLAYVAIAEAVAVGVEVNFHQVHQAVVALFQSGGALTATNDNVLVVDNGQDGRRFFISGLAPRGTTPLLAGTEVESIYRLMGIGADLEKSLYLYVKLSHIGYLCDKLANCKSVKQANRDNSYLVYSLQKAIELTDVPPVGDGDSAKEAINKCLREGKVDGQSKLDQLKQIAVEIKNFTTSQLNSIIESVQGTTRQTISYLADYVKFFHDEIDCGDDCNYGARAKISVEVLNKLEFQDQLAWLTAQGSVPSEKIQAAYSSVTQIQPSADQTDPMQGLIQLSHTEPMAIYWIKRSAISVNNFYTYRDMCENCRKMVEAAVVRNVFCAPLVVVSSVPAGFQGAKTAVDYELVEENTQAKLNELLLGSICQIRIPEFKGLQNVKVAFENPNSCSCEFSVLPSSDE